MAGPYFAPHPGATPQNSGGANDHLVFVPVDGRLVFFVCVLLICACLLWLGMLLHKGVQHDKEA